MRLKARQVPPPLDEYKTLAVRIIDRQAVIEKTILPAGSRDVCAAFRQQLIAQASLCTCFTKYHNHSYRLSSCRRLSLCALRVAGSPSALRVNGGVVTPSEAQCGFGSVLPKVHLHWNAAPDILVRPAWTNTIGRAHFGDITARETLNIVADALPALARGNLDLKPREVMGLDLSAEY